MLMSFSILKSKALHMENDVFRACIANVRDLKRQRNRLKRLVNRAIRERDDNDLCTITKLYALLYSTYVEAAFLKLVHTPNAFNDNQIMQIKSCRNIEEKWVMCEEFALTRYNSTSSKGELANKRLKLCNMMKEYIIKPSQIRNKVAHGQWCICLNNDNTDINGEMTNKIKELDFVKIDRLFYIYEAFQQCMLDMLISPKTHYRDYYIIVTKLEEDVKRTKDWSIETKKERILKSKKQKTYDNFHRR